MVFSASQILMQLGGNQFIAMTGAKNFVKDDKNSRIWFRIGRSIHGINLVQITYDEGADLYDMEFIRASIRNGEMKRVVVSSVKGVFFDQLQEQFTEHTGLYTHL